MSRPIRDIDRDMVLASRAFAAEVGAAGEGELPALLEGLSSELLELAGEARGIRQRAYDAVLPDMEPFPVDARGDTRQYKLIYCDPPWQYDDKGKAGNRGAAQKYDCLSVDELAALPVRDLRDENTLLAMWWVPALAREALDVIEAWGFQLITMKGFTWHKLTKNGKSHFGMGHWTRANTEDCLFARFGRPARLHADVRQFVETYRSSQHSRKPHEVRLRLERLMGDDIPRIELFARQARKGWDVWGNQAPEHEPELPEDDDNMGPTNQGELFTVQAYERTAGVLTKLASFLRSPRKGPHSDLGKLLTEYREAWIEARTPDEHGMAQDALNEALLSAIHRLAGQARDGSLLDPENITPEVHEMIARIQSKFEDEDPHEPRS